MRRRTAVVVLAVLLAAVAAVARGNALLVWSLPRILGLAAGASVSIDQTTIGGDRMVLRGLRVRKDGEPLFAAEQVAIAYNLRDLLPGSAHRFGLLAIELDRPVFTLERHADGSYNLALGGGAAQPAPLLARRNGVPLAFTVRVRDGVVHLRAPHALDPQARRIDIGAIDMDGTIDTATRTHYRVTSDLFTAAGTIDATRGYAMHRVRIAALAIRPIANFFINSRSSVVLAGTARSLDLQIYALGVEPEEPAAYHVGGRVYIDNAKMRLVGLAPPVEGLTGELELVDDELFFHPLHAHVAGVSLAITGSIFEFPATPQFRIGINGVGDLRDLRTLFAFAKDQDLAGPAHIGVSVDGGLEGTGPRVLATVDAAPASYRNIVFDHLHASIAYSNSTVFFMPIEADAHGARFTVRGDMEITDRVRSRLALHVDAHADDLPYAGALIGNEPLTGDFTLDGHDLDFYGYGALESARSLDRAAAVVHVDRGGILDVAPLWFARDGGTFAGGYHLDRVHDTSAFWVRAAHLTLQTPAYHSFFEAALATLPPIDATIDEAAILGGGHSGTHALLAGALAARDATIAGVRIDRLRAHFAGTLADAAIDPLVASGPWGALRGSGAFSFGGLALHGNYRGTLQGLRQFMSGIPASGAIDGAASLAITPQRLIVQTQDLHMHGATIHGIPISSVTGTLAIDNGVLRIESARAQIAGGNVVAAGTYGGASGADAISLIATHLAATGLRGVGMLLDGGELDADGTIAAGAPLPTFEGGVALRHGRVHQFDVAGTGLVALRGDGAHFDRVVAGIDGIYATATGSLDALSSGSPVYRVDANVPAADLGRAVSDIGIVTKYNEGTFKAGISVRGAGLQPQVNGVIAVPAGSINGLYYTDASSQISADRSSVALRNGTVEVGSTHLEFGAAESPSISALRVRSPHADLSDFNDFFDTGDTLDGDGAMRFDVVSQAHRLSSNGDLAIAHFRYRNLPIGTTDATWSSEHNILRGSLDVDGPQGSLRSNGEVTLASENEFLHILRDSRYALRGDLRNLDLSTWVAALGYPQVAVTGRVNASATIDGRFPELSLRGNADLVNGTIWRLPIQSASTAISSTGGRLTVESADLSAPGVHLHGSGSFGFGVNDPVAFTISASSDDVPTLLAELFRTHLPISGLVDSTLTLGGTLAKPAFDASFNATDAHLYGIDVPQLFGSVELRNNELVLHGAGAEFDRGTVAIEGSMPLSLNPLRIGPAQAPVNATLTFNGVDPSLLDGIAGNNTKLGGAIDGEFSVTGTVGAPHILGNFNIKDGSYVSDLERTPITAIESALRFDRTSATVQKMSARFGTGTVTGSGQVTFANGTAYALQAKASGAQLDLPAYGRGSIDADLSLTRAVGQDAKLTGSATLSNAAIPFAAFIAATQNSGQAASLPIPLDLDVQMNVGRNVRVRGSGYGAGLDIGATGGVHLAGSLAAPTLSGSFAATGGTLTYYDRAFRVQAAKLTFTPADGVIPTLHATATTRITNPDPSSAYNSVDVTVAVDGSISNPRLSLSSSPPGYTNDQLLAMIAPFGGVLLSNLNYLPTANTGLQASGSNASFTAGQEAFNILNAQFSAGLLSPLEGAIQQSLGFQSVNVTLDYLGNVGVSASRFLGKTVNFVYAATFGIPQRTSFGLQLVGERATSAQLSFFFANGPERLFETPLVNVGTNRITAGLPLQGQNGFAFTLQRLFW
ncbi:MAG TPA: translocation/assembly module TamB domain-containing protein [Candidatus Acidoferrales bacterium]|nr:translocation/assembly module TamB domain-containing protein [Candidatus Acidoferrales bacterium]